MRHSGATWVFAFSSKGDEEKKSHARFFAPVLAPQRVSLIAFDVRACMEGYWMDSPSAHGWQSAGENLKIWLRVSVAREQSDQTPQQLTRCRRESSPGHVQSAAVCLLKQRGAWEEGKGGSGRWSRVIAGVFEDGRERESEGENDAERGGEQQENEASQQSGEKSCGICEMVSQVLLLRGFQNILIRDPKIAVSLSSMSHSERVQLCLPFRGTEILGGNEIFSPILCHPFSSAARQYGHLPAGPLVHQLHSGEVYGERGGGVLFSPYFCCACLRLRLILSPPVFSDKYITVREQNGEQVQISIIDTANPSAMTKRPITADSALMNPVARVLALKGE
jgi:hypothetical protein